MNLHTQSDISFFHTVRFRWLVITIVGIVITITVCIILFLKNSDTSSNQEDIEDNENPSSIYMDQRFERCPEEMTGSGLLTSPILPLDKVTAIIPLGNFTIPGHILPVDHNYYGEFADATDRVPVFSPGNLTLINISEETSYDATDNITSHGFVFRYVVCRGVIIDIASGDTLKGNAATLIEGTTGNCQEFAAKHEGNTLTRQCNYEVDYQTYSGEIVAETGFNYGMSVSGEVWAFNYNMTPDQNVNWELWSDSDYGHAFCLFDLYRGDLKVAHESKMGRNIIGKKEGSLVEKEYTFTQRTIEPVCGTINQDIQGTAQGSWFWEGRPGESLGVNEDAEMNITLSYDNVDPSIGRIVIGGTFTDAGVMWFTPLPTGTINRDFSEVTPDGQVYCYNNQEDISINYVGMTGKILIQLEEDKQLRIEHKEGPCQTQEEFTDPFAYIR